jgi:3'-phosphoadenosine 5'-phosphosulfate (PAPS) 3'-phosphatase
MSRLAALRALFAGAVLASLLLLLASSTAVTPEPAVAPHLLFETLARALVAAGDEVVALAAAGGGGGARGPAGAYRDGSAEVHTRADARASEVLARVAAALPGLVVIDEERVAAGSFAGAGAARAAGRRGRRGGGDGPLARAALPLAELSVWLDPLDASAEYAEGLHEFVTLSACVARRGVPVAGLIYAPFKKRLYWAVPGSGASVAFSADAAVEAERARGARWDVPFDAAAACSCDGGGGADGGGAAAAAPAPAATLAHPRVVNNASAWAAGLRVVVSRSHSKMAAAAAPNGLPLDAWLARAAAAAGGAPPTLRSAGGAGYKVLELIERRADVYAHARDIRKWDVCAGDAILREGGALTDLSGRPVCYCAPPGGGDAAALARAVTVDGLVAAGDAALHAELLGVLQLAGDGPAAEARASK